MGVIIARGFRRKADVIDAILFVTIVIHALMLLSHRTNGGWQYGTRYLCDLLPAPVYVVARLRVSAAMMMGALITFNVYATVVFESL